MSESFLPENYEIPKTSGNYLNKFEEGTTKIRILSNAVIGYEYFSEDKKVHRSKEPFTETPGIKEGKKPKELWVFKVYNYEEKAIQICQISQVALKEGIMNLYMDSDYGDPAKYDIKITRTGTGMNDTKYSIIPGVIKEIEAEIKELSDKMPIYLEKVFTDGDPFTKGIETLPGDENIDGLSEAEAALS